MNRIDKIIKKTNQKYLNMYELEITYGTQKKGAYYVASRAPEIENLKIMTRKNTPDGVIIYSLFGEKKDKVVLIRQYRYALDDYIYEFPAGLVDAGETYQEASVRELYEETGLAFTPIPVDPIYSKPYFTTIGMTDESCATVYGYATGEPTRKFQEELEDIEVVLADKNEVRRILKEENVAIICSYMLMHFLQAEEGETFRFLH